jgi:hypothetical protein
VATRTFAAPATAGSYVFRIDNPLADVIETLNPPPNFSPVNAATVAYGTQTFRFVLTAVQCTARTT